MAHSRHVFVQVDCSRLIANIGINPPSNAQVRENTAIYDQGAMALGNPVESFAIPVTTDQDVYFTILPLVLFSYHKLYFTDFKVINSNGGITVPDDIKLDGHQVSFKVPISNVSAGGELSFDLYAMLEYQIANELVKIPLCIDPVLRANQGNG
ncbi:hypothetical protein SAMN05428949_2451 [Chitinophaga sp. YR627]|uniref:hypothetical protein n=1 Tax=Chitinophaga sp. YR627 TaxID=1881041 RepID=UPI0008E76BF2|nr:hypothetical protein [Chitinophaga sp. YR627]SFN33021.1 hypothetical protein SAMN05428949_2451 [Chitinophaga sp. YR627]